MKPEQIFEACKKRVSGLRKHKYAIFVLLIGIGLMLYPHGDKTEIQPIETHASERSIEEKLEEVLSRVEGAGSVRVLLTMKEGPYYSYQTNEHTIVEDTRTEQEKETIMTRDANGAEAPVIINTRYPLYEGALIVCEGADIPTVRLCIVSAVSDLTGLGADKISVIKMKGN